jgi:TolB protein
MGRLSLFTSLLALLWLFGCSGGGSHGGDPGDTTERRADGAHHLDIREAGSLQNAAWSPDSQKILLTRFVEGYNQGPADLLVLDLETSTARILVADGSTNVNNVGSCWNRSRKSIVFSSSREPHDEVYIIDENSSGGAEEQITSRNDEMAFEPSFSPDGTLVVFESHPLDVETSGTIVVADLDDPGRFFVLTGPDEDCRQPNWSPTGEWIIYQKLARDQFDLWIMAPDGSGKRPLAESPADETDASFSPDGQWIVYSSNEGELPLANLFIRPVAGGAAQRVTFFEGYDGAPSWSPDGQLIAFESIAGDPDQSAGTTLWTIESPVPVSPAQSE